jgi:hypothetical protein
LRNAHVGGWGLEAGDWNSEAPRPTVAGPVTGSARLRPIGDYRIIRFKTMIIDFAERRQARTCPGLDRLRRKS